MASAAARALAAALPDGSLAHYETLPQFLASGGSSPCPITLVDAGNDSDQVITELAGQAGVTAILTGIGPPAGSDKAGLQVIYRLGSGPPGWLTSASTRRAGVVALAVDPHLDRLGTGTRDTTSSALDGVPIQVLPASVTVAEKIIYELWRPSQRGPGRRRCTGHQGAALLAIMIISLVRRRLPRG
jgi:hypothetical protein